MQSTPRDVGVWAQVIDELVQPLCVAAGDDFSVELRDPPGGLVHKLGVRVEVPYTQAVASPWAYAALEDGMWCATLLGVILPGFYLLHWLTNEGRRCPEYQVYFPLMVDGVWDGEGGYANGLEPALGYSWPLVDHDAVRPTVGEIARLERTRTNDGFGNEYESFTDETRPSATDVEEIIDHAMQVVLGALPGRFPPDLWPAARRVLTLYSAMSLEASFFKEQTQGTGSLPWETEYNAAFNQLQASIMEARRQNNLLGAMEPRGPGGVPIDANFNWSRIR